MKSREHEEERVKRVEASSGLPIKSPLGFELDAVDWGRGSITYLFGEKHRVKSLNVRNLFTDEASIEIAILRVSK